MIIITIQMTEQADREYMKAYHVYKVTERGREEENMEDYNGKHAEGVWQG